MLLYIFVTFLLFCFLKCSLIIPFTNALRFLGFAVSVQLYNIHMSKNT